MYNRQASIVILMIAILAIILSLIINQPKEKHEYLAIEYRYGMGVKSYEVVFCLTDSMQVLQSGKHIETRNSREYFYGDD